MMKRTNAVQATWTMTATTHGGQDLTAATGTSTPPVFPDCLRYLLRQPQLPESWDTHACAYTHVRTHHLHMAVTLLHQ